MDLLSGPPGGPGRSNAPAGTLVLNLIVEPYLNGVRIDTFLTKHLRNYTPWRMQRLVQAGAVQIDEATAVWSDRVFRGQSVRIALWEPPDHLLPPEPQPIEVLYEDEWLIVVNKPAGVVVHPCGMHVTGSLANHLQAYFDTRTPRRGLVRPGVIHRLDRLTSGVICCSKEHSAHRFLAMGFEKGHISKQYLALVAGRVQDDRGDIRAAIGQTPGGRTIRMSTRPDAVDARASRTMYEVLERFERWSLVRCRPLTGRLHQIRVHMASIGHPLLADEFYSSSGYFTVDDLAGRPRPVLTAAERAELYRSPAAIARDRQARNRGRISAQQPPRSESSEEFELDSELESDEAEWDVEVRGPAPQNRPPEETILLDRQALHAEALSFLHPIRKEVLTFVAPLAKDLARLLPLLRGVNGPACESEATSATGSASESAT